MLTDSGGFQVFSLETLAGPSPSRGGVPAATSMAPGGTLTPERAMEIQWDLGADIAMAFDHVVPGQATHAPAEEGMERTLRWLDRCRERHGELAAGAGGADALAHHPGRHARRSPPRARSRERSSGGRGPGSRSAGCRSASRSRSCTGCWRCWDRPCPADVPPLSYGSRISAGSAGGNRARGRPVRLRRRHPQRAARHRLGPDRPGQRARRRAQGSHRRRSTPSATARPAPPSPEATSATCSWRRTCWDSGSSRSTTSGSWSASASRPGRGFWTERSEGGAGRGWSGTPGSRESRVVSRESRVLVESRGVERLRRSTPELRRRASPPSSLLVRRLSTSPTLDQTLDPRPSTLDSLPTRPPMLQSQSGSGITVLVLQMAAIGLVFYFLILRPSGQAQKSTRSCSPSSRRATRS